MRLPDKVTLFQHLQRLTRPHREQAHSYRGIWVRRGLVFDTDQM